MEHLRNGIPDRQHPEMLDLGLFFFPGGSKGTSGNLNNDSRYMNRVVCIFQLVSCVFIALSDAFHPSCCGNEPEKAH